ncbi:hypothetical protein HMPREF9140_00832 [Prevotella micans F0438]|uniref:Uncharacterized protein n=1 Tax=Prevotella micans F0438 TaxID=883158 RepID=H1Q1P4_9BACT|nr:hypothetical protein [Prevotella micans]EHO71891.1 hypothetical protein HMPREF9140_00832 [Prevotella micans F0438]
MKRRDLKKRAYIVPWCRVIETECESFICISGSLDGIGSNVQNNYDDKGEHNMGSIYLGDPSSMAPAKQQIGNWEDE